jgi:hypothetical protein
MQKNNQEIFHSSKFVVGFVIFAAILLTIIIYPLFVPDNPLKIIGRGTFFKPGTYISVHDSLNTEYTYTLKLDDAAQKRLNSKLSAEDRVEMKAWLVLFGILRESTLRIYSHC